MIMINGWGNFMIMINDGIIVGAVQVSHEDKCCIPHAVSEHCSGGVSAEANINHFTAKKIVWRSFLSRSFSRKGAADQK